MAFLAIASTGTDGVTAAAVPVVNNVFPNQGPTAGGIRVTISGSNLTGTTAVHFGAKAGTAVLVNSSFHLSVAAPAGAAGTVHVTVTTPAGTSAIGSGDLFTYTVQPVVNFLNPNSGLTAGGTRVHILGI